MIRLILLLFAFVAAVVSPVAPAQTSATSPHSGLSVINKIILGTPGISAVSVGGSTAVAAADTVAVRTGSGLVIPVAETAAASVGASRLAGLAVGAMRVGTVVGVATIIAPFVMDQAGIVICPPPDFFCKKQQLPVDPTSGGWAAINPATSITYRAGTPQAACDKVYAVMSASQQTFHGVLVASARPNPNDPWMCNGSKSGSLATNASGTTVVCPPPGYVIGFSCVRDGALVPVPDAELIAAVQSKANASAANQQSLYDAARAGGVSVFTGAEPVTVTAPPVTSVPKVTTEQISNPDGSTSTKLVTETSTVTPTKTGTTINDTNIYYPITTTTTTNITNNVTNVTTTTTNTKTEQGQPDSKSSDDLPTDYAREATLQRIEQQVAATGAPKLPDQVVIVDAAKSDSDTKLQAARDAAVSDRPANESLFWKFVWTPPAYQCSPYTGTIRSTNISIDLCSTITNIRSVIGWLLALFTSWTIYGLLFKRSN
ncbi:MAG: hypothetical protein ABIV04_03035 [Massilia sp.]